MPKAFIYSTIFSIAFFSLAACANTFQGAGEDIENAGEYIQDVFE